MVISYQTYGWLCLVERLLTLVASSTCRIYHLDHFLCLLKIKKNFTVTVVPVLHWSQFTAICILREILWWLTMKEVNMEVIWNVLHTISCIINSNSCHGKYECKKTARLQRMQLVHVISQHGMKKWKVSEWPYRVLNWCNAKMLDVSRSLHTHISSHTSGICVMRNRRLGLHGLSIHTNTFWILDRYDNIVIMTKVLVT